MKTRTAYTTLLLAFLHCFVFAQKNFTVTEGSQKYTANMTVASCNQDHCEGKGTIVILDKSSGKTIQSLVSKNLYFNLSKDTQKPSTNTVKLYGEQSPLIFEDFNFDGSEDLAIRNGNWSSYGGPSYDVYVFNITKKKFVLSEELTKLAIDNLGMFYTDRERKRLVTYSKSGCCWHMTTEYEVVPKEGLKKVYEFEEDATGPDDFVEVTTRELVNGKWKETSEKHKIEGYYKN